jgi:hypothetical protein
MKNIWLIILTAVFLAGFIYTLRIKPSLNKQISHPLLGQKAPLENFPPKIFQSENSLIKSNNTFIVFVASWCYHCSGVLKQLHKFKKPVWLFLYHDTTPIAASFKEGIDRIYQDKEGRFAAQWGIRGVPEVFMIGPQGQVSYHKRGRLDSKDIENIQNILASS